jgi:hypothetical protein
MAHGPSLERASAARQKSVFLNLPYDARFDSLFLAYVAGTSAFGLIPRATLEIPGGARRLDRILALIESCQYSIHDMSRVQLNRRPPPTPRFNMPFELGLTVGYHTRRAEIGHTWFVFETRPWRLQKSLSDLNGTDVYVHEGTPAGVFRELLSAFVRHRSQPTVRQMTVIFEALRKSLGPILQETGADSLFEASVFRRLSVYAIALADKLVKREAVNS